MATCGETTTNGSEEEWRGCGSSDTRLHLAERRRCETICPPMVSGLPRIALVCQWGGTHLRSSGLSGWERNATRIAGIPPSFAIIDLMSSAAHPDPGLARRVAGSPPQTNWLARKRVGECGSVAPCPTERPQRQFETTSINATLSKCRHMLANSRWTPPSRAICCWVLAAGKREVSLPVSSALRKRPTVHDPMSRLLPRWLDPYQALRSTAQLIMDRGLHSCRPHQPAFFLFSLFAVSKLT